MKRVIRSAAVVAVLTLVCAGCTAQEAGQAAAAILSGLGAGLSGL